jgi:hypothetical protein
LVVGLRDTWSLNIMVLAAMLMQGDVYVKRRSGQGVAVYETRCAELGITPCSQVGAAWLTQL